MPQPATVDDIADDLVRAYAKAWENVVRAQEALGADPAQWRKAAKLRELQASIQATMDDLDSDTSVWLANKFPQAYALGASSGADALGKFVWNQASQAAVQRLASDLHQDLLKSTKQVRRSTKALIRSTAKDAGLATLLEGQTAIGAARVMAKRLEAQGINAIKYVDGSTHGLREYAEVAIRTKTAVAYNNGMLDHALANGVAFFEVFDGPFCGWTKHDDPELALGLVVSGAEAQANLISHPNCRRSFGARPDVANQKDADKLRKAAAGSVTAAQTAAQKGADARGKLSHRVRASRARADGPGPALPQAGPQTAVQAARAARAERALARRGRLDLQLPSEAARDIVLSMADDPYRDLKSVEQLRQDGFSQTEAEKEYKRLKANAASRASKAKARAGKAGLTGRTAAPEKPPTKADTGSGLSQAELQSLREQRAALKPLGAQLDRPAISRPEAQGVVKEDLLLGLPDGKNNPAALHNVPGGRGFVARPGGNGTSAWDKALVVDTPNLIPVVGMPLRTQYTVKTGLATRRDGIAYLMETSPGQPVDHFTQQRFERYIKTAQEALGAETALGIQKSFVFAAGKNPDDAYFAKKFGRTSFRSEASAANGHMVIWGFEPKHGTIRHEFGHSLDSAGHGSVLSDMGSGLARTSNSRAWADAMGSDQEWSYRYHALTQEIAAENFPFTAGEGGVTQYGAETTGEDFAESVRLYSKSRRDGRLGLAADGGQEATFTDIFPERAKILAQKLGLEPEPQSTWSRLQYANAHEFAEFAVRGGGEPATAFELRDQYAITKEQAEQISRDVAAGRAGPKPAGVRDRVAEEARYFPGLDRAKASFPDNVRASIASAKSRAKRTALTAGKTAAEADRIAAAVEELEAQKRWYAGTASRALGGMVGA